MLKRNKMLALFLVIAVLCMSIGFAVISDTLTATGTFTLTFGGNTGEGGEDVDPTNPIVQSFDEDVYFSAVATPTATGNANANNVTATINNGDSDTITITIDDETFTDVGEVVTVKATIKSDAAYAVKLATPVVNESSEYFTVTSSLLATQLDANGSTTLTIEVKLDKIPANVINNEPFSVTVVATPAA